MLDWISSALDGLIGFGAEDLTFWHLLVRALLVYGAGLVLVRLGKRRFMGSYSAFDMVLGITVGALLATASASAGRFLNALILVFALVVIHWALAVATQRWAWLDRIVKGKTLDLVRDGQVLDDALRRTAFSKGDLIQAIRWQGVNDLGAIKQAVMERSGQVSIVQHGASASPTPLEDAVERGQAERPSSSPSIVEVEVKDGVQRVVIEIRS
jgi:uncharacterized membrane protein YcaP (DUF421 family)